MSDYFERIEAHLLDAVEREAKPGGARAREAASALRGHQAHGLRGALRGPRRGLWLLAAVLLLGGSAAAAVLVAGERSRGLSGVVPPYDARGDLSLAGSHYEIAISPSLQAGTIGWCTTIFFRYVPSLKVGRGRLGGLGGGSCPTSTPAVGSPLFAADGFQGPGLSYVLTAPQVAAVRVADGPTVLTRGDARLPFGFRAAVFELPPRAVAHGRPRFTALDAAGRAIPGGLDEAPPREPARFWYRPQRPARGSCSLTARRGAGLQASQGTVLTAIVPDPGVLGRAYLACVDAELQFHGVQLTAAVLLDARRPGAPPAPLPDMRPVPGAPGVLDRTGAFPSEGLTAVRTGAAWLVVQGQDGVSQRLRVLRALRVGAIDLRLPRNAPRAPAGAPCAIVAHPLAGLREVSQTAQSLRQVDRALAAPAPRGTVELAQCAQAGFYYRDWPLSATVLLIARGHGSSPRLPDKQAVSGHPGVFTVRGENGVARDTARRVGDAWLEIEGGSGTAQQLIVLERLAVRTPAHTRTPARNGR